MKIETIAGLARAGRDGVSMRAKDQTIYAIGDIHGCYTLLIKLLERIIADINGSGHQAVSLVFLGDYVDRGPASLEVLTALVWIKRQSPLSAIFVKGNHDQIMLDYIGDPARYQMWLRFGGSATLQSYGVTVPDEQEGIDHFKLRNQLVDRLPASHLDFLKSLQLSYETERFIFVHAGIQMGVPMARQAPTDLLNIRNGFLAQQAPGKKRVVHGHTWTGAKPQLLAHRIGVDTGAYETGVLAAVKLLGDAVTIVSTAD